MGDIQFARPQRAAFDAGPKYALSYLAIPADPPVHVVVLSQAMAWFELHWYSGKHCPCTMPSGYCYLCQALNLPTTPHGYFFAQVEGSSKTGVLHLTGAAVDACPALARVRQLRGVRLTLSRRNRKPKGHILIDVTGDTFDLSKLPPAGDIEAWMQKTLYPHALPVNPTKEV